MFTKLKLTFEITSPMFLGGAESQGELRSPSIKGAMRYWYRAINPNGLKMEPLIFGGAGADSGQSAFFMDIDKSLKGNKKWNDINPRRFDNQTNKKSKSNFPLNGVSYFGFPFPLKSRNSYAPTYIEPDKSFNLNLFFPKKPHEKTWQGVLASAWLLGHLGSLGSRSRRGFGSISITDWKLESKNEDIINEFKKLPVLSRLSSREDWMDEFDNTLKIFNKWFDKKREKRIHHPHFGDKFKYQVGKRSFVKTDSLGCINEMGVNMQSFRQYYQPDYNNVKDHLEKPYIQNAPERASFGLPLKFQYRSLGGKSAVFMPKNGERHGSLLHMKPVLINDKLHPLYLRLDGDVPGGDSGIEKTSGTKIEKTRHNQSPFIKNAMDEFLKSLEG